ncbi:hypothetical protein ACH5RR_003103 [Cinchona calisaya]|uniref:Phorbol-ester/DAG-type domain-containing protein n=1 Tax=Cinchona calisaya TaxID=153742 RepID=A0ABD3AUI5_9GENT
MPVKFSFDLYQNLCLPEMQIEFCNHPHPLVPCKLESKLCCNVCIQEITLLPLYGCIPCKYFLHKSCAEFEKSLKHPFHPEHTLLLRPKSSGDDWCAACCKSFVGGCSAYNCRECDLKLCIDCSLKMPNLKWEGHVHSLAFIKAYYGYTFCGFCNSPCCNGESVLHCVPCDFVVHPRCIAELPQSIEVHHRHLLFLNDSLIEDMMEDLYCSVCEKLRTPNQLVYSCNECDFVSDLYCAIQEILPDIIINNEVEGEYSNSKENLDDPVLDEIDKEISVLRDHSMVLKKTLEGLNLRAKELTQDIEKVDKDVEELEKKRTERASFSWSAD